jgi:hypothetical protein
MAGVQVTGASDDRTVVQVTMENDSGESLTLNLTAERLLSLIEGFADMRSKMMPEFSDDFEKRSLINDGSFTVVNPKLYLDESLVDGMRRVAVRTDTYGWIILLIKADEAARMAATLLAPAADPFGQTGGTA